MRIVAVLLLLLVPAILPAHAATVNSSYEITDNGIAFNWHLVTNEAPQKFGVLIPDFAHFRRIEAPNGWGFTTSLYTPSSSLGGSPSGWTWATFFEIVPDVQQTVMMTFGFETDRQFDAGCTVWAMTTSGSATTFGTNAVYGPVPVFEAVPEPPPMVMLIAGLAAFTWQTRRRR